MSTKQQSFPPTPGLTSSVANQEPIVSPASADCRISYLSHLGLIAVSGPDTDKFLQGQFTNDMRLLTKNISTLGSHANPKGRVLALCRLMRWQDTVYLQLPINNVSLLLESLIKYRLRAKLDLEDTSAKLATIGLTGECLPPFLQSIFGKFPNQINELLAFESIFLVRLPGTGYRVQILGLTEVVQDLWTKFAMSGANIVNNNHWLLEDIRSGLPTVYPETAGMFLPQMLNLHKLNGVSFAKGCYTGQEVIARLQHLGSLKRGLCRAKVATSTCPHPGTLLYAAASTSEQGAGNVVSASLTATGECELLAVVELAAQSGEVRLVNPEGHLLQFLPLPNTNTIA
ncbi:hypothetical protein TI04_05625 [Achromatium sp. WMS2]|nr:hypothetical protein TI04_05625 [Achromatium sp. WMS2]